MSNLNPVAAIKTGWQCTKENFIVSLGLVMAYIVVNTILSFITGGVVGAVAQLLNFAFVMVWSLGMLRISLDVVDGEEPRFAVFKEVLPRMWQFLMLMVIMIAIMLLPIAVILVVGAATCDISLTTLAAQDLTAISTMSLWLLLAMLPLIYLSIRLLFAPYLLLDRGVGAVEAIKMAWKASYPVQGRVFLFLLLSMLVSIIGVICFIVGYFVAMVVIIYAQAALYRQVFPAGIQDPLLVEDTNVVVG